MSEEEPDEFGYYSWQYCKHGIPDTVVCDSCKEEEAEI